MTAPSFRTKRLVETPTLAVCGAIGLPIHIFIDRQGKISTYRLGEMDPGEIEAAIQKIL